MSGQDALLEKFYTAYQKARDLDGNLKICSEHALSVLRTNTGLDLAPKDVVTPGPGVRRITGHFFALEDGSAAFTVCTTLRVNRHKLGLREGEQYAMVQLSANVGIKLGNKIANSDVRDIASVSIDRKIFDVSAGDTWKQVSDHLVSTFENTLVALASNPSQL
jgi:hypothetical protein